MNARTLVITAGAVVALAAPAVANARIAPAKIPSKHAAKKHVAKPGFTRQGRSRQLYIYVTGPVPMDSAESQLAWEQDYNDELIAHGLDPVVFPDSTTVATDASTATAGSSQASTGSDLVETVAATNDDDCSPV